MPHPDLAIVTGAFSYTGRYVARRLLDQGVRVRTLTRSPNAEDPLADHVETAPLDFSDPDGLSRSMQGAGVFYNTYWIRYAHGRITFDLAVENTGKAVRGCKEGGRRQDSPLLGDQRLHRTPGCRISKARRRSRTC